MLEWTSRFGQTLSVLVRGLPVTCPARVIYPGLADRYNLFLTKYETLLQRLPNPRPVTFARLPR